MSLTTPIQIRTLQRKLYLKAKAEPACRFYLLYDKIYREDILAHAYQLAKANEGAPGVDEQNFREIRVHGAWLKVPVEERDEKGNRRMTGGKQNTRGTPQGGVISPLLANLYMNRFLKYWRSTGKGEAFQAQVVTCADDFVILSRGHAKQALDWTRQVMTRIELTLNEAKTSIRQARQERFDFLGYTFGPHRYWKDGHWYLGTGPSKKSVSRVRQKIGAVLRPSNVQRWEKVRDQINRILRGWAAYFSQGTRLMAYRAIDHHVYTRVRLFLIRRHKVPSRGAGRYPDTEVFGSFGVLRLRSIHLSSLS